jgi:hypothetical protein
MSAPFVRIGSMDSSPNAPAGERFLDILDIRQMAGLLVNDVFICEWLGARSTQSAIGSAQVRASV